jgi:hypothetical protein
MSDELESDYAKFRGKCKTLSEEAVAADPALTLVRGHYLCPIWGEQGHWWTVRPDGSVFDPTARQFPSKGIGEYIPFTGFVRCESCGKEVKETDANHNGHHVYCSGECLYADVMG